MKIDRERALAAFHQYVSAYDIHNEKVRLKIEHTEKVADLCDQIASSLELSGEETDLAWLIGVLHDVGRFEQLRIYNTFMDGESVNHAMLGGDILFSEGRIRDYVEDASEDALLEMAVRTHSAYQLQENLDKRMRLFCNIIRDADKIDILRVNTESPLTEIYNTTEEDIRNACITEAVMDCIRNHHAVLKSLKKTAVDNLAGHIAFTFELVFPCSRDIMIKQGFLEKVMNFQSDNSHTVEQFKEIKNIVYSMK